MPSKLTYFILSQLRWGGVMQFFIPPKTNHHKKINKTWHHAKLDKSDLCLCKETNISETLFYDTRTCISSSLCLYHVVVRPNQIISYSHSRVCIKNGPNDA